MSLVLNEDIARKVLETVDAGLIAGLGNNIPGQMCVEAAVCFAYGLPHSDNPPCVGSAVRQFKIKLNDARWSGNVARTAGMRALAIAQLGSSAINQRAFTEMVVEGTIRQLLPMTLRRASKSSLEHAKALTNAADACERDGNAAAAFKAREVARDAVAAAYADADADAAAYAYADAAADAAAAVYAAAAAYAGAAANAYAYADAAADAAAAVYAGAAAYVAAYTDADAAAAAAAYAAAYAYADAAAYAAADEILSLAADIALQALTALDSPGCQYLYLLNPTI